MDDDFEETIAGLKGIKLGADEKFDKVKKDIEKWVDRFEKRLAAYARFERSLSLWKWLSVEIS